MNEDFNNNSSSQYRYVPESTHEPEYTREPERAQTAEPYIPSYSIPEPEKKSKKKKNGKHTGRIIALVICCSLLFGILGAGGAYFFLSRRQESAAPARTTQILEGKRETATVQRASIGTDTLMTPAEVYEANVASTVGITTEITTTNFWGYASSGAVSGSGFILTADGYIVTNYHVIEGATSISVSMYDESSHDARLIGYDQSNDIAVLKIDAEGLVPVVLGSSDDLRVGDYVLAIGNPLGELTFTLTQGIVSALNRNISTSAGTRKDLIQTDCAINSGNSGGAFFNLYGEVVGITNAKYSSSGGEASVDNIGFAIPIDLVRSAIESIIENGYLVKPYIGVSVGDVSEELQSYGLPAGAAVKVVKEKSPAEAAGLEVNDIITEVNGTAVANSDELTAYVTDCKPGDVLELKVYRQSKGGYITISITVAEQQQSALAEEQEESVTQQPQYSEQMPGGFGGFGDFGFPWSFFGF